MTSHRETRRRFLATLPALTAFAQSKALEITAVEVWQLHGLRDTPRGVDQQYQVNPLDIYDELRPRPYSDAPRSTSQNAAVSAHYLKIKTDGGPGGLYGPIDKEVAIVVDEQLRPFLLKIAGQSPAVCPLAEYLILKMRSYYHFEKAPPVPVQASRSRN